MVRGSAPHGEMIPLLFLCWFAGSLLLFLAFFRRQNFRFAHRFEEIFFGAVAGLGWMSVCAAVFGLFGLARPAVFWGLAVATAAACVALLRAAPRVAAPPPVGKPAAYLLCAACLAWFPLVFVPPFFYDTLRYHYALPAEYLRTGLTWPLPHFVESNRPLGVEMLSMIGMSGASWQGANVVNFVLFALCGLGIMSLADRLGGRRAGWIAVLLFLSSSASVHILFLAKPDLGVTLFFFSFVYALLAWLDDEGDRRFLLLAAALAGVSMGTKYTMVLSVGVAFVLALFTAARARGGDARPSLLRDAALFCGVAALLFAPWLVRNAVATGNPVYPVLNGLFGSPTWSAARMAIHDGDSQPLFANLHGWRDAARLFGSVTFFPDTGLSGAGASLGAGIVGALIFALFARATDRGRRFLGNLAIALCATWFLFSWISRYLLPALPVMVLLTGFLGERLWDRAGRHGKAVVVGLAALAVGAQLWAGFAQSPIHRAWAASFSFVGHPERRAALVSRYHPSLAAVLFAGAKLPPDAKLLFLGETRVYYLKRAFDAPSAYDEHPIARIAARGPDAETVRARLVAMGYTHILANWAEWDRLSTQYYARLWEPGEIEAAARFARGLPAVYSDRSAAIYSLARP